MPFSDSLASWGGPEFDWDNLQDIYHVDPATILLPLDEYPPEYGFGFGRVPSSACAVFNPVDSASKLPDTTYGLPSVPLNPSPAIYYNDKEPYLGVNCSQLRLSPQESGVVYHDASDNTSTLPELGPPTDYLSSPSQNSECQFVPPNDLIPSNQPRAEETGVVSLKRKRRCKDTVWLRQCYLVANIL